MLGIYLLAFFIVPTITAFCNHTVPGCVSCNTTDCTGCQTGLYLLQTPSISLCVPDCTPTGIFSNSMETGTCVSSCTCGLECNRAGECISRPDSSPCPVHSFMLDGQCTFAGCPSSFYPDFNTFECLPCHSSCLSCHSSSDGDCTSCSSAYFLDLNSGKCEAKLSSSQHLTVFVSHLTQHTGSTPDGSLLSPFFDLRDALSFVEDMLGRYEQAEGTIFLTVGEHFLPLRQFEVYQHALTNNNDEQLSYNLTLKPLPCSLISGYQDTYGTVCSQDQPEIKPKVQIHLLIGAYFSIIVPRSLSLQGIIFNALGSETLMSQEC